MRTRPYLSLFILTLACLSCDAQQAPRRTPSRDTDYPPQMPGSRVEVYKTIGDVQLKVYIYEPAGLKSDDKRPAIVFFFGGGWAHGSPRQFEQHCRYLASRGMVAMTADYRVTSRHKIARPSDCIKDAKAAIRWIRKHSSRLGIDSDRIAAGGGSAGGHLAAATAMVPGCEHEDEDNSVSSAPNALVLFNPALAYPSELRGAQDIDSDAAYWPAEHVRRGVAPMILFFGTADTLRAAAAQAVDKLKELGNRCELVDYEDQVHGFFNFANGRNKFFFDTLTRTDRFLISLGYLQGEPTVDTFEW